jgi:hypothetical protein
MFTLGLLIVLISVTIQGFSYIHVQGTGNQSNDTLAQQEFEEGEEIGEEETL